MVIVLDVDFSLCCGHAALTNSLEKYATEIRSAGGNLSFVLPGACPNAVFRQLVWVRQVRVGNNGPCCCSWSIQLGCTELSVRCLHVTYPRNSCAAFGFSDAAPTNLSRVRSKSHLKSLLNAREVTSFQEHFVPSSHSCDQAKAWILSSRTTETRYAFGCEPYLLHSRRNIGVGTQALEYDESFVGYGKNRVSFHYEMAAIGLQMKVIPDVFVYHSRFHEWREISPQSDGEQGTGTSAAKSPVVVSAFRGVSNRFSQERTSSYNWMTGETCAPSLHMWTSITHVRHIVRRLVHMCALSYVDCSSTTSKCSVRPVETRLSHHDVIVVICAPAHRVMTAAPIL